MWKGGGEGEEGKKAKTTPGGNSDRVDDIHEGRDDNGGDDTEEDENNDDDEEHGEGHTASDV